MSVLNFVEARTVTREDLAGFAQVDFKLTDSVTARAGLRYQDEEQLDESVQFFFIPATLTLKDHKYTWKLGLDFNVTEDNLLYGLVSTGWKNGGANPGVSHSMIAEYALFSNSNMPGKSWLNFRLSGFGSSTFLCAAACWSESCRKADKYMDQSSFGSHSRETLPVMESASSSS